MYGEIKIKVGELYTYKDIISLDYDVIGDYTPQISYPIHRCQNEELPEVNIKKFVIEFDDKWDYKNNIIELVQLDLDLGVRYECKIEYTIKNYELHNDFIIIEVA